jgi:DNA (cytosine-5)-methyltransferase 1
MIAINIRKMKEKKPEELILIDLFCGAGGFSEGFKEAGYIPVLGFDKCQQAKETYEKNIGAPCIVGDICEYPVENILDEIGFRPGEVDIIIGGPPCQGFSLAGKKRKEDRRNQLYEQFVDVVKYVKPSVFVMENVPVITSHDRGYTRKQIYAKFEDIGYSVTHKKLNAVNFGAPQTRERVFFAGSINGKLSFPPNKSHYYEKNGNHSTEDTHLKKYVSSFEAISDLLLNGKVGEEGSKYERPAESEYQTERRKRKKELFNHVGSKHTTTVVERFSLFKEGDSTINLPEAYRTNKMMVKRLHSEYPAPTVMTLPDDIIHYSENRILTVREMARLQSFDDTFRFYGKRTTGGSLRRVECPQYTLVGNAVPPILAKAIALELKNSPAFLK